MRLSEFNEATVYNNKIEREKAKRGVSDRTESSGWDGMSKSKMEFCYCDAIPRKVKKSVIKALEERNRKEISMSETTKESTQKPRSLDGIVRCPKCESEKQVWRNQITNKITCHRY